MNDQKIGDLIPQIITQVLTTKIEQKLNPILQEIDKTINDYFGQFQTKTHTEKLEKKNQEKINTNNMVRKTYYIGKTKTQKPKNPTHTPKDIYNIITSKKQLPDEQFINIFGKIPKLPKSQKAKKEIFQSIWNINSIKLSKEYNIRNKLGRIYEYFSYPNRCNVIYRQMELSKLNKEDVRYILNSIKKVLQDRLKVVKTNQQKDKIINCLNSLKTKYHLTNIHFKP